VDDDPEKFKTRSKEYLTRTKPVMDLVKKRGYKIAKVNGAPAPHVVFKKLIRVIGE
jgi:adenylate kinase family enzyme